MSRKQRYFARDHAQSRTAWTARGSDGGLFRRGWRLKAFGQSRQDIADRAAVIDLNRAAFPVEQEYCDVPLAIVGLLGRAGDGAEIAGRDKTVAGEGDVGWAGAGIHGISPIALRII